MGHRRLLILKLIESSSNFNFNTTIMPDIRSFYVTVLSQELSPCEEFLAAGTNYGNINIFNLNRFYSGNNELGLDVEQRKPWKNFPVSSKPIQGMASSTEHLIVGGKNQLYGYSWNQLKTKGACKETKPSWTINLNIPTDFGSKETVDYITLDKNGTIFVACGDNCIRAVDMEYGKVTSVFSGHDDLIHSMSNFGSQLSSASEDGTVCLWDTKRAKWVHTLVPHLEAKLSRPNLGKWLGAVALNEDWLVSLTQKFIFDLYLDQHLSYSFVEEGLILLYTTSVP